MNKKREYIIAMILIVLPIILGIIILINLGKEFYGKETDKELRLNEIIGGEKSETLISTLKEGDTIEFSEKEWVIINKTETAVGVILKDYIDNRRFCGDMKTRYSLTDRESLLYYLNEYFIKNLDEDKIIEYNWETGPYKNEKSSIIKAKVGLLTRKEFLDLEMSGISEKFKLTDGNAWWLLTPSQGEFLNDGMSIVASNNQTHEGWIKNTYAVKPVVYILNNTRVIAK